MPRIKPLTYQLALAFGSSLLIASTTNAFAQDAPSAQKQERIEVTGSNIPRADKETASPVQVITAEDLKKSGYTTVSQVLSGITANGQGTLSQGFSGAFASGASGVALRGLTVGATLVLIDGHRVAPYPIGDDGQRSFVDISNIPFDAVERIEVLKDGASAIYGSDAVAGVVNIILKKSFVGKNLTLDLGTSQKGDGNTFHVAGTVGFGDLSKDGHNFYIAGEIRKQDQILFADRGGIFTNRDYTSTGGYNLTPGVPNTPNGGFPASGTGYVADANGITGFMPGCDATKLAAGQCTYKNTWSQIQPKTENYNLLGRFTQKLDADWQLSLQGSYLESRSQQVAGPSLAFSGGYQGVTSGPGVVPALTSVLNPTSISSTNPSYPQGTGLTSGLLNYTFLDIGPNITNTIAKSTRFIADLQGRLGAWDISTSVGYSQVALNLKGTGYVNPYNLQAALDSTTNPYLVGGVNSQAVKAFIAPTLTTDDTSKLTYLHAGGTRELTQLPGGALGLALGLDFVRRDQNALAPRLVADGQYAGSFSNNYTVGTQTVSSAYAELLAPITKQLEAEVALRYDRYNLSGSKASPKFGIKYQPISEVALRGTAANGFRAPGPAENGTSGQTFFLGNSVDGELCKNQNGNPAAAGNFPSQCSLAVGTVQSTNPALKPETSKSYTLGLILQPFKELSATIDIYSIAINNQIVTSTAPSTPVRGTNFTPIPINLVGGGTALVAPPVAPIAYLQTTYVNANKTTTSGIDLDLQYTHKFESVGEIKSDFMVTYMNKYDVTIDGKTSHLAGTHGPLVVSGDTGNPKSRIHWANTFSRGPLQITGTVNYIGAFDLTDPSVGVDTCQSGLTVGAGATAYAAQLNSDPPIVPNGVSCKVSAFTTFDLSGKYEVTKELSVSASILNLFNKGAPLDWGTYGGGGAPYNPSLHSQGAIGRFFNVGLVYKF